MQKAKKLMLLTCLIYVGLISLISIMFYEYYQDKIKTNRAVAQKTIADDIASTQKLFSTVIFNSINAVTRLAEMQTVIESETLSPEKLVELHRASRLILQSESYLSEIYFINPTGQQLFRVNKRSGDVVTAPKSSLKNESAQKYFQYLLESKNNASIVYDVQLENSNGKDVRPYNSIIKIASPTFINDTLTGFIVSHVDLLTLKHDIELHIREGETIQLILPNGFIALDSDHNKLFGNIIPSNAAFNLANIHPNLWQRILQLNEGAYIDKTLLAGFKPLDIPRSNRVEKLTLLLSIPVDAILPVFGIKNLLVPFILATTPLTLLTIFMLIYFYGYRKKVLEKSLVAVALDNVSAMILTDENVKIIKINKRFEELSGCSETDVIGANPSIFSARSKFPSKTKAQEFYKSMWDSLINKGVWEGELINQYLGSEMHVLSRIVKITDSFGRVTSYAASYTDISEQKKLENKLLELSEKDPLTQCWNRRKYNQELERNCELLKRYPMQKTIVLALIDIDFFKTVNDTYGHDKGDEVIKGVGRCLTTLSRNTDLVARIGGEEFALIMPHTTLDNATTVLERMCCSISQYFDIPITVSVGVTDVDTESKTSFKRADQALYSAKNQGRHRIVIHSTNELENLTIDYIR